MKLSGNLAYFRYQRLLLLLAVAERVMSRPEVLSRFSHAPTESDKGFTLRQAPAALERQAPHRFASYLCQHYSRGCDLVVSFRIDEGFRE